MNILECIWFVLSILIIGIILSSDPKNTTSGSNNNQLSLIFTSTSDSQKVLRNTTWFMISIFYISSLLLSYYL